MCDTLKKYLAAGTPDPRPLGMPHLFVGAHKASEIPLYGYMHIHYNIVPCCRAAVLLLLLPCMGTAT